MAAINAKARIKRSIFITCCNAPYILKGGRSSGLVVQTTAMVGLERLKSAPYAETNDFLFLIEGEGKSLDNLVFPGVGIIRKDQAKRYVQDGNLDPNLHSNTGTVVAQFGEKAL